MTAGGQDRPWDQRETPSSSASLTDLTGVFAALGKDITNAQALYWEKQNAGDKVCGKYTVELEVKDHGYVTQQGVQLYGGIHDDVLAIEQTIGSPINTALAPQFESDHMVNIPAAWAAVADREPAERRRRRDLRGRDDQRPRLPPREGQDQGGRQDRPHLLRG